ncbi:hypothetical protein [Halogranum rubrum]|uniref:DUF8108 domain-containing protein n=1 Tax=Halogranum salarium B-1 TaxID=1210908 RepID=J3JG40_9EURY|nr:hypothetical protein [Halogranum salarium]EJN59761.1 hypothetical protein HSB1_19190 [Halogranum salarium B-1]
MDRRVLAIVGVCVALFVAFLARGVLLSVGRVALVALLLALVAGVALLVTREPAYGRFTVGERTRILRRPVDEQGAHRCVDCEQAVTDGERRRFVREWVLFGVPLVLLDDGENVYCSACAGDETSELDDDELLREK